MAMPFQKSKVTKMGSFLVCMKDAFDVEPGRPLMDFVREMRHLNEADRTEFKAELARLGYKVLN